MIELRDDCHYIGFWFVPGPSPAHAQRTGVAVMDHLACLWRDPDGVYHVQHRFHYHDAGHWGPAGTRRWYHQSGCTDGVLAQVGPSMVAQLAADRNGTEAQVLSVDGDAGAVRAAIAGQPWASEVCG